MFLPAFSGTGRCSASKSACDRQKRRRAPSARPPYVWPGEQIESSGPVLAGAHEVVGASTMPPLGRSDGALTIWLTGLPSSGKTTVATGLFARVRAAGWRAELLDGDVVRTYLSSGLGFSRADRDENVRRVGRVADLLSRNGVYAICALVSPYRSAREEVRLMHGSRFFEVHVAAPLEVCEARDVKGLYASQRAGRLQGLTGVDDPYEPPLAADLVLPTHLQSCSESVLTLWDAVQKRVEQGEYP